MMNLFEYDIAITSKDAWGIEEYLKPKYKNREDDNQVGGEIDLAGVKFSTYLCIRRSQDAPDYVFFVIKEFVLKPVMSYGAGQFYQLVVKPTAAQIWKELSALAKQYNGKILIEDKELNEEEAIGLLSKRLSNIKSDSSTTQQIP